jgi:hypothetical protein
MSLQSSRREWAQTRLSLGITNDPWLWLYMISRGYSVLCVKTLLYLLMFIKSLVKVIHCVTIAAWTVNAETECIIIHVVRYWIACRLSYYISYMHGYGISRILIPTFGYISYHSWQFLALEFWRCEFQPKSTWNSLVLHQIDSGLSYFAFYMRRVGIYGLLIMTLGGGWYQ